MYIKKIFILPREREREKAFTLIFGVNYLRLCCVCEVGIDDHNFSWDIVVAHILRRLCVCVFVRRKVVVIGRKRASQQTMNSPAFDPILLPKMAHTHNFPQVMTKVGSNWNNGYSNFFSSFFFRKLMLFFCAAFCVLCNSNYLNSFNFYNFIIITRSWSTTFLKKKLQILIWIQ